jgi:hypothetical protein
MRQQFADSNSIPETIYLTKDEVELPGQLHFIRVISDSDAL